jgi:multidrug efflux pump subunit AcrA (membrane-fusion protein)
MAKDAAIRSADAEMVRWQAEVVRADGLLLKGVYDKQTRDQDWNQWKSSVAKKDEATANWHSSEASHLRASAYYNKTLADIEVAAASLDVAKAARDQWRDWLAYSQITAPYDGVVTLRNVHKGHFLQPSNSGSTSKAAEPLFVMMRTDIMRCTVDVPELDSVLVKDGDKAVIQFDAMPGVETIGTVTRNAASLDERTRTLRVEVWLEPKGATLKYTASADGVIIYVDPIPPQGGTGYPRNATIPLLIPGGSGGIVNATTNAAGVITKVDPIPREGGAGYPRSATVPLPIAGGTGGTVNATTNAAGVITHVEPTPLKGGTGYARNATLPLSVTGGTGGVVNATTNAAGEVVAYTLNSGGRLYTPGTMTEDTICDVLRPFMYAHVTILGKVRNAWELPAETVVSDILANDNRSYCFVVEDGKARKMFLQVGARCDEGLQILRKQRAGHTEWENITGQEVVVATNSKALQDGQEVRVKALEPR